MKKALTAVLMAALLMGMAGCASETAEDPKDGINAEASGVEIRIDRVYTEEDRVQLKVIWSNQTGGRMIYGEPYSIERLEGKEWVSCAKDALTPFITVGYALEAGQETTKTYTVSRLFDVSRPGTYRFKTSCSVYEAGKDRRDCSLWVEFTLGQIRSAQIGERVSIHPRWK